MWPPCGTLRTRVALARSRGTWPCGGDGAISYTQGQSPEPRTREYFYYVDHQGQLFLDDSKTKNFITCFKDPQFLVAFFSRLRPNRSGRYEAAFPFVSPCGRERNFLRCEDRPVVGVSAGKRISGLFPLGAFIPARAGPSTPTCIWGGARVGSTALSSEEEAKNLLYLRGLAGRLDG
ncbi:PREDICTED: UPF0598 protein C8orf82 homolog [Galeopterus variegatus]|uniref:UPF0598 protein C8orf82 homolog n=1 Tax=Galeopterus variegatus TaxID=482537 RepID=A0ABM0QNN0_GALVR|nr:PREDICTED: UPF0598 protein C8orf82 homolog [Galeopterus variegatus]